jgi:hypothetical protein
MMIFLEFPPSINRNTVRRISEMYQVGKGLDEIANEVGIDRDVVIDILQIIRID